MRILYMGLPLGALHLTSLGYRPVIVALGHPDAPGARRVRRRLGGAGTLVLGRPDLLDMGVQHVLREARPDALLSWFWPHRIPRSVLELSPRGSFGVHPSLLPRWRGPDPYFWALAAGDAQTGATLHHLDEHYDTGPVVETRTIDITDADDAWSLARRLDRPALSLLGSAVRRLASGESLPMVPQDANAATDAPAVSPMDLAIDFRTSVEQILRLIRAAAPEPGATADFAGHDVEVLAARRYETELPAALEVTEARCVDGGVAVRARDGAVLITVVRAGEARLVGEALHRFFAPQSS